MTILRDQKRKPTHTGAVLRVDALLDLVWRQGKFINRIG